MLVYLYVGIALYVSYDYIKDAAIQLYVKYKLTGTSQNLDIELDEDFYR